MRHCWELRADACHLAFLFISGLAMYADAFESLLPHCTPLPHLCPAGTKSKEAGCRNAAPGYYVRFDGQTSPLPCEKGKVQPLEGQSFCAKCPIEGGAVSEGTGGTRCVPW